MALDFEEMNGREESAKANVTIVTVAGTQDQEVEVGTSIGDFKSRYGLEGTKIVDEEGDALNNSDIITNDMQLFIATPKKNG